MKSNHIQYSHNDAIHINHALAHLYFTAIAFPESEAANHKGHIHEILIFCIILLVLSSYIVSALIYCQCSCKHYCMHYKHYSDTIQLYTSSTNILSSDGDVHSDGVYQLTFPCICIIMKMDRRHPQFPSDIPVPSHTPCCSLWNLLKSEQSNNQLLNLHCNKTHSAHPPGQA